METHRGNYLRELIGQSEFSITQVAEFIKVGRGTLHRWLNTEQLSLKKMIQVAEAIGKDITIDFPAAERIIAEEQKKEVINDVNNEGLTLVSKYTRLLEKYNRLLENHSLVKEELFEYKTRTKSAPEE